MRRKRIPVVRQMHMVECGAASLAMVLGFHGRRVSLDETREVTSVSRDGVSALTILRAARWYGLEGHGYRSSESNLSELPRASILHWGFQHFVVFDRVGRRGVHLVDPEQGRTLVSFEEFNKQFTGVYIATTPGNDFEESKGESKNSLRLLYDILRASGHLGRVAVLAFILLLLGTIVPVITSLLVDRIVPESNHSLLLRILPGAGFLSLLLMTTVYLRNRFLADLQVRVDAVLTLRFMKHLSSLPYSFILGRSAGDLMMRANSNAELRQLVTSDGISAILDALFVVIYLFLVVLWSPFLGLVALCIGAVQAVVFWLSIGHISELHSQQTQKRSRAQGLLTQLLEGMETFKASGGEEAVTSDWGNLFVDQLNCDTKRAREEAKYMALSSALEVGGPLILMVAGTYELFSGALRLGEMLAMVALAVGFLRPLLRVMTKLVGFLKAGILLERLDDVLQATPEREDGREVHLLGAIEVRELDFLYSPVGPLVLSRTSFQVKAGEFVAVVGASGSGKSTLALLMLGMYDASSGTILYDGVPLNEIELASFRKQVGVVSQRSQLFAGTIRSNILFGQRAVTTEKVIAATKAACLHEDIMAMAEGYDTVVSEGANSLSGGQCQRLALARALVREPSILFLDEATSALDSITEAKLQENLAGMGVTRIVIAHRLSTIRNADRILVMHEGELVESGTHEQLIVQEGVYSELVGE